ncbi:MAG TPA: NAD(P)/FAD-dependent oxidoreductase [Thermomicrobiales bacterium]|nr:NAD(P)/FAD-dependent oxidoreductase [Thermomicrobiales bacterium]
MTDPRATDMQHEAVVVGSGPNGLAAGISLAEAGHTVRIYEANDTIGGGCRSLELTLPGFVHDLCSAIHPLAVASPFFRTIPMASYGLEWANPPFAVAHPFDDGSAAVLSQSLEETAASVGEDGQAWIDLFAPLVEDFDILIGPLLGPFQLPRHPIAMARFGLSGLQPAHRMMRSRFSGERARALFAGLAGHSIIDLNKPATAAFGLVLGLIGHVVGWPLPKGGSQQITNALVEHFRALGGEIVTGTPVTSLDIADGADAVMFDVTPKQFLGIVGDAVPGRYRRQLEQYRYGGGVFKIDWALDGPVPWTAEECAQAGTVHLGATMEEIVTAEHEAAIGRHPERPFVILAQQSLFDETRAPDGKHTLWGYCHVPNGSIVDMTERIEAQIERFAPEFRECIIERSVIPPAEMEVHNANYIGGDINGGIQDIRQLFTRPVPRLDPYSTPNPRLYFCSASTPPGGGVHGMGGYHGARSALRRAW